MSLSYPDLILLHEPDHFVCMFHLDFSTPLGRTAPRWKLPRLLVLTQTGAPRARTKPVATGSSLRVVHVSRPRSSNQKKEKGKTPASKVDMETAKGKKSHQGETKKRKQTRKTRLFE